MFFFIKLLYKLYRPKPFLPSGSLNGESARDAYSVYLLLVYMLLRKTYSSISVLETRKNEKGTSYFLGKKNDLNRLLILLEGDIKSLSLSKTYHENFEALIHDELSAFVKLDLLVAEKYPIICSYCVEMSSLRIVNQLTLLSKKGDWPKEAVLFLKSTQKKDTQEIMLVLKKLSKKNQMLYFFL